MQFSIIIPTKNEIKNLRKTLPQFQMLEGKFSYEVIIADGKSDDGTIDFARSFGYRVEVKTKEGRETIGEGRNRGARVAQGEILVFIDAGVVVDTIVDFFTQIHNIFSDVRIVAAVPRVNIHPDEATFADVVVHGLVNTLVRFINIIGLGAGKGETQIVRKTAFERVAGYNEALAAAEDNDLFRRLARIGKVVFLRDLQVFDNPSRYRKLGYPRVIVQWILNQLFVIVFGRSYSKEWKRVD